MRRLHSFLVFVAVAAPLAACAGTPRPVAPDEERVGDFLTVIGALAYRERVALVPGSVMQVSLSDISKADAPATLLAEQTVVLDGQQVPIPFAVSVDRGLLQAGHRYAVRGHLKDSDDRLMWTTDTVHVVDRVRATHDLGTLSLVRVPSSRSAATINATYDCGDVPLRARFAEDRVFITVAGTVHELPRARSASGARYALAGARPVTFWDKGAEALFEDGETAWACRRE